MTRTRIRTMFAATLILWGITVFAAGSFGFFTRVPLLVFGPLVLLGIALPLAIYYLNSPFRFFIQSIRPSDLTAFHVWRVPAGLTFLYYGSQNLLPHQFVLNAGYGDIVAGLLALLTLLLGGGLRKYLFFNFLSLLDFVVAVGTGITFTLLQVPSMQNIRTFPIVLIPMYGVCVTGALSVMALDSLLRKKSLGKSRPQGKENENAEHLAF